MKARISPDSFSTMGFGVTAGTKKPCQATASKPGRKLGDGRDFRIEGGALGRCCGEHRELAGLHLWQQQWHVVEGKIDLAAQQIRQHLAGALVGHMHHLGTGHL
jgi:hypothetical protein